MDAALLSWGRAVKQRRKSQLPVLWLFTDSKRLADPLAAAAKLPKGICGVVLRHDGAPGRDALARRLAKLCKARRLKLVVAGDVRLAAQCGAGVHLRAGRWPGNLRCGGLVTSSAHNFAELRRAKRAGAKIIFLSPAFATGSHPAMPALGPVRWARLAGGSAIYALGGVDGRTIKALGRRVAGAGAIGAFT